MANVEQLYAFSTVDLGVRNEAVATGVSHVCGCGMTFVDNQRNEFMRHYLQCPEGAPIRPPGAESQSTLRKQ